MILKKQLILFLFAIYQFTILAQASQLQIYNKAADTAIKYPKAVKEQAGNSYILEALETKTRELETIKKQSAAAHLDDLMHHKERNVFVSGIAILLALVLVIYFLYNKRAKQHDKTLSSISQYQSHELRSPLVKIMGLVAELKKSEAIKDPETKKQLQMLEASAEELDIVIHEIVKKSGGNRD